MRKKSFSTITGQLMGQSASELLLDFPEPLPEFAEGELYNDTLVQMNMLEKRNCLLKARRSSVCLISNLSPDNADGRGSVTPDKKLPALLYNQPKTEIEQLVQNFHKYSTCPGTQSEGPKKVNLPVPGPLAKGRLRNSSMFSVSKNHVKLHNKHHRGSMELGGVIKEVVGDLSKKMKKTRAKKAAEIDPLAAHLKKLKPISKGSSKMRSLSVDLRREGSPLRRTKSSAGALVVYSMKPEVDAIHCPHRRKANVNMKSKIFQRAVFAIRVQNKISMSRSVWK